MPLLADRTPGDFYMGIDIGRQHDRTVFWVDRVVAVEAHDVSGHAALKPIATTTLVKTMNKTPFAEQLQAARELLSLENSEGERIIRRACIDATGIGAMLAETLATEFGHRVEPVTFTAPVKEDLAFRTKRLAEGGQILLPENRDIRRAFGAIKKTVTVAGAIRFDAARTEAGHADEFWAKSLADLAAEKAQPPVVAAVESQPEWYEPQCGMMTQAARDLQHGEPTINLPVMERSRQSIFERRLGWR